jgi:hypothetical protein
MPNPPLNFKGKYRALALITLNFNRELEPIIDTIRGNENAEEDKDYYGFAFGKYDLVVDLPEESAKVASFKLCNLLNKLSQQYETCGTFVIGREFYSIGPFEGKVRSYTFLSVEPSEDRIEGIVDVLKTEQYKGISLWWNPSAFELVLTCDGDSYETVVKTVRRIRGDVSNFVIDGSTLTTLRAKEIDKEMTEECVAVTYLKLHELKPEKLAIPDSGNKILWFERYCNPVERLGWFDCCLAIKFKSLKALHKAITDLRVLNLEKIRLSSTMLLYGET